MTTHKHNPYTGGHLCKSEIEHAYLAVKKWTVGINQIKHGNDLSENYLGGEWCCENDWRYVTCKKCKKLKNRVMPKPRQRSKWSRFYLRLDPKTNKYLNCHT